MLEVDSRVFVSLPQASDQRHRGLVVESEGALFVAEFDVPLRAGAGSSVDVEYVSGSKFVRMSAVVQAHLRAHPKQAIRFMSVAEPELAETRRSFRVYVINATLFANVGEASQCPLVDISAGGFSAIAAKEFQVDDIVAATLSHNGQTLHGRVRICSRQGLEDGRFRYGLQPLETERALLLGLGRLTAIIQQEQMRRVASRR